MPQRPHWKKWLFALIKLAVLLLLVWFLRATLRTAFAQLREHPWHVQPAWLLLAGCCYVLGQMPVPVFWCYLMRSVGQPVGMFETIRAWWVGQIGKYIPGKALVLVLRTGLLRSHRLENTVVIASVFTETLTAMAVGSLIAFVVLLIAKAAELLELAGQVGSLGDCLRLFENSSFLTVFAALAMFVGTALPTWPPNMKFLIKLLGVHKINATAADKMGSVPYRVLLAGWLMIGCGWFVQGLGLWAVLRSLDYTTGPPTSLALHTATVAMSAVAGFLSFIPGGAGVREAVLTELLVTDYGSGPALVTALIWRLVMLVAEALLSCILYFLGPRTLRHKLGGKTVAAVKPL